MSWSIKLQSQPVADFAWNRTRACTTNRRSPRPAPRTTCPTTRVHFRALHRSTTVRRTALAAVTRTPTPDLGPATHPVTAPCNAEPRLKRTCTSRRASTRGFIIQHRTYSNPPEEEEEGEEGEEVGRGRGEGLQRRRRQPVYLRQTNPRRRIGRSSAARIWNAAPRCIYTTM